MKPEETGWIEWRGGECPVAPELEVYLRWGDGAESEQSYPAGVIGWRWIGDKYDDIIAYRLAKP